MGSKMIFISLGKFRKKPTKEMTDEVTKMTVDMAKKEGIKILSFYWTLGRYDTVVTIEAADEKAAMKMNLMVSDFISTQTMVGIPREEAIKLVEEFDPPPD
jgi:uncharacterized protein with GYD domain